MDRLILVCYVISFLFAPAVAPAGGLGFPRGVPSEQGNVPVAIQDQSSEIIDLYLIDIIDTVTLTAGTAVDDTDISIDSDTLPVAGNLVCLKEDAAFYQGSILSVTPTGGTGYDLLLDTPLDYNFTTAGGCSIGNRFMNVNGSVTPVIFSVSPFNLYDPIVPTRGQQWDITRIMFAITDDAAMDDARFGGISGGLTNGIVMRKKDGLYKNIFNVKTNGDFAIRSYDVTYIPDTLGPAGEYGLRVRRTFAGPSKNGVTVRLDAEDSDEIQVIVRDDLSSLSSMSVVVQGHIVESAKSYATTSYDLTSGTWVQIADGSFDGIINFQRLGFYSDVYFIVKYDGSAAPTESPAVEGDYYRAVDEDLNFSYDSAVDIYAWANGLGVQLLVSTR